MERADAVRPGAVGSPVHQLHPAADLGVVGLARVPAERYGRNYIGCIAVWRSAIDMAMFREFRQRGDEVEVGREVEKVDEKVGRLSPTGCNGQFDELAAVAQSLGSEEGSYVNRTVMAVDGAIIARAARDCQRMRSFRKSRAHRGDPFLPHRGDRDAQWCLHRTGYGSSHTAQKHPEGRT